MNTTENYPNLLRVARELAQCKHPRKAANMLVYLVMADADLAKTMHEAEVAQ